MWTRFWYVVFISIFISTMRYFWKRRRLYLIANSLKGPPTVPFFGNALLFQCKREDILNRLMNVVEMYPSPIRFWLGPKLVLILNTASHIEKVITSTVANNRDDIYKCLEVFNGQSMFSTNGSLWKKQRRYVAPFLGRKHMDSFLQVINKSCEVLIRKLEKLADKNTFDVDYFLCRCYNDIICETLTGYNPDAQNEKMEDLITLTNRGYALLHSRMVKAWLHPEFIFNRSANGKEQKEISTYFRVFLKKSLRWARRCKTESEAEAVSVYENLRNQQMKYPEIYNDQIIEDHIATLYTASEDTATSISSYLLVLLGMYPDVQDKVVQEINEVFNGSVQNMTYQDLTEMKYLDMCIKETLRLFPIAPYILRKLNGDLNLDSLVLPKDITLLFSLYSVHRSLDYWEKPNEFYPEHFLPDTVSARHPFAFLPFSAGSRSCPGQLLAIAAIKAVAITVLHNYVVEADGSLEDIKVKVDISIRSVNGYKLRVRRRR